MTALWPVVRRGDEAARPAGCDVTSLVWARPDALWLLALVPLFALTGIWLGTRRGRLPRVALLWRLAVVTLLALGLAEPMIASGSATGGVVFVVDHSDQHRRRGAGCGGSLAERCPVRRARHASGRHRRLRRQTGPGHGAGVRARSPRR